MGYTGTALALEFKRMGMSGAAIASFAAVILLPWSGKFLVGPLVDNFHFPRFGHRKQWIFGCQIGMLITLALAMFHFPTIENGVAIGLGTLTGILIIHNIFAAVQDVAIDGLACTTLHKKERGIANGLMFAAATAGNTIGGSVVIYLKQFVGFELASLIVPLLLIGVLTTLVLFIVENQTTSNEPSTTPPDPTGTHGKTYQQILHYLKVTGQAFFGSRRGFLGLCIALLPIGGMALSMIVSTVLSPTLGMTDGEIARIGIVCSLIFLVACIGGGFLSDRYDRRLCLSIFALGTLIPTLWIGWMLHSAGWHHPSPGNGDGTWPRHDTLIHYWWIASVIYSVFQGLMYGVRSAFFMDIVNPEIASTHFTAFMALMNLTIFYSMKWEGYAITPVDQGGWGLTYLQIFIIDALLGSLFLFLIPFIQPNPKEK